MNQENKLISVNKEDFLKIISDFGINRINIIRNPDYEDGIMIVAGNKSFKEFMKCKIQENHYMEKEREQKCEDCEQYKPLNKKELQCKLYSKADPKGCIDFEPIKGGNNG